MNWEVFFRPTIAKIAVFAVVSVLFVPFIDYDNGIRCFTTPCPAETTGSTAMWLFLSYNYHIYEYHFVNLVSGLILSYIASCLAVLVANRLRKK